MVKRGWTSLIEVHVKEINDVWYAAAVYGEQIYATTFTFDREDAIKRIEGSLPRILNLRIVEDTDRYNNLFEALNRIFNGEEPAFNFEINMDYLTDYRKKVLLSLAEVPKGYVTTYGLLSKVAGGGARSVGNVMAKNPFPLILPCHRVIRHDLTLGNFGHGRDVKKKLLMREDEGFSEPKFKIVNGKKLKLFPIRFIKELKR